MKKPSSLARRRRRRTSSRGMLAAALVLVLATASGCSVGERTAYCQPQDPVVTPQRLAPGDELVVETVGNEDGRDCTSRMPSDARYEVSVTSEEPADDPDDGLWSASLGLLDPSSDGAAKGTVRVPDDIPLGPAEISLNLQGADTVCDIDPTIGCAPNPSAPIVITG